MIMKRILLATLALGCSLATALAQARPRQPAAIAAGPFKELVSFENPGGGKVLVFANDTDQTVSATLLVEATSLRLDVPAQSMNAVILP